MAGPPARRASYKDTLQPALHRRFSSTATLLLAVSYLEAVLLAGWRPYYFWAWFPLGPAGIRTAVIFSCGLSILVLRIAHYHVGLRTSASGLQTLAGALLSLRTYETAFWYGVSSLLFCPVFLFSLSDWWSLRWITYISGDRAKLNEEPLFLACYLMTCALLQTLLHYYCDIDRLKLSLLKPGGGEQGKGLRAPPASFQAVLAQLPAVFVVCVAISSLAIVCAVLCYFALFRSVAWGWALTLLRPLYNLPSTSMLPPHSPLGVRLLGCCVYAGTLLTFVWWAGNTAFSIFMVKEPLKDGKPLTSESKDPNGSLLNGLKSKKMSIQSFAMWELALIAQDFDERRRAIYCDIDRKDGPMWAQVYAVCMGLLKSIETRIDGYGKPPAAAAVAEPAPETPRQRVSAPPRDDPIFNRRGQSQASGLVEKAYEQIARSPGSSPVSELSPLAKKAWRRAKDRMLSKEQQEALSPKHVKGALHEWAARVARVPYVGAPFRHGLRARFAAAALGTPYAEATLYAHAAQALCRLAVHSLEEDEFGNVHRDVASIVRTLTSVIRKLEAFAADFGLHRAGGGGGGEAPELDLVLDSLRTGLGQVVASFEPYSSDLRLSLTDVRLAKEAAARPEEKEGRRARAAAAAAGSAAARAPETTKKTEARGPRKREQQPGTAPEMEQLR